MKTSTDARARRGWLKNEMRRETLTWRRVVKLRRAGVLRAGSRAIGACSLEALILLNTGAGGSEPSYSDVEGKPGIVTNILAASGGQKRKPSAKQKLLTAKNSKDAKKPNARTKAFVKKPQDLKNAKSAKEKNQAQGKRF